MSKSIRVTEPWAKFACVMEIGCSFHFDELIQLITPILSQKKC